MEDDFSSEFDESSLPATRKQSTNVPQVFNPINNRYNHLLLSFVLYCIVSYCKWYCKY